MAVSVLITKVPAVVLIDLGAGIMPSLGLIACAKLRIENKEQMLNNKTLRIMALI